jgi:hypothetical protein
MNKLLIVVAALGVTAGVWHWRSSGGPSEESTNPKLAYNRLWIDHMPRSERDLVNIFVMIDDESMGVFQATTVWRGAYELFRYEGNGEEVRIHYPQTNEKVKAKVRAKKCNDNGFDFCLEVDGATRGVKKYYSYDGWEIDNRAALDRQIQAIERAAPHDE